MNKSLVLLFIALFSITCYSQIDFEKGYFIDNSNQKVECLIRNVDVKLNPTSFEYKQNTDSNKQKASLETVKEFGIYNKFKYISATVDIDQSSDNLNSLSKDNRALFKEEKVFLNVLIEGKANLYSYQNSKITRYFYSKEESKIEQLIFKEFLNQHNQILKNNRFKQQLLDDLKCGDIKMSNVENLKYKKNDLINFFIKYNECHEETFTTFNIKEKQDLFNLTLRPGLSSSSLSVDNDISIVGEADFDNVISFRFGIEAEFIMPFYRNKWAIIIEPTYHSYQTEKDITAFFVTQTATVDYTSIELPVGIRHYLFLNENSKIFLNASFIFDLSGNSVINYEERRNLDIKTSGNLGFGIGYKQNDKYSIEFRYHTNRDVLTNYTSWNSNYNSMSLILGYSLF